MFVSFNLLSQITTSTLNGTYGNRIGKVETNTNKFGNQTTTDIKLKDNNGNLIGKSSINNYDYNNKYNQNNTNSSALKDNYGMRIGKVETTTNRYGNQIQTSTKIKDLNGNIIGKSSSTSYDYNKK
jgi:hypothetical protein